MEYLQHDEVKALLTTAYEHNREHHLVLLLMYATGTRVSQALRLTGFDIIPDHVAGGFKIRMPKAKRGFSRCFPVVSSTDLIFDMTPLVDLAKKRGSSLIFGGLDRHYLHRCIKRYADLAGLHSELAHCHTLRHSDLLP